MGRGAGTMILIHTVAPGETLFSIAARYGVTVASLVEINQPPNPDNLVIGQTLIVPTVGLTYTVRPGDTLFRIAQTFGITVASLVAANRIADPNLIFPGQILVVPGWEALIHTVAPGETLSGLALAFGTPLALILAVNVIPDPNLIFPGQTIAIPLRGVERRPLVTNGFILPVSLGAARRQLAPPVGPQLTYVSIFDFPADGTGGVVIPNYGPVAQAAREQNIAPLAVLTNFTGGNFSPDLARSVLANAAVRERTIDSFIAAIRAGDLVGSMVDFENMYPEDRNLYTAFIGELTARLRPLGLVAAIAVAPKWADFPNAPWVGAFDYAALGAEVDFMFIMTYEWGWVGGPPQPVAPVNLVRRVIAYATSLVSPSRIMQGLPLYGYDWPLPDSPETLASTVDPQQAISLAARYGAVISFMPVAETPTFNYTDAAGQAHVVYFEDARSVRAKYQVTRDFNLMGAGYWQLGDAFPQNWAGVREMFAVRKVTA